MKYFFKLFLFASLSLLVLTLQCRKNFTELQNEIEDCGGTDMSFFSPSDTTGEFVLLTGVKILPRDEEELGQRGLDDYLHRPSFKNVIHFDVFAEYMYIDSAEIPYQIDSLQLGDPLTPKVINPIYPSRSKCALRFSKDIKYKDQLIPANENLLNYDDLVDNGIYWLYTMSPFAIHTIELKKELFEFKRRCYEVYAEWHTIYDEVLSDTVKVYIDVN